MLPKPEDISKPMIMEGRSDPASIKIGDDAFSLTGLFYIVKDDLGRQPYIALETDRGSWLRVDWDTTVEFAKNDMSSALLLRSFKELRDVVEIDQLAASAL